MQNTEPQTELRSLAGQARRRWRLEAEARYPQTLQAWLGRADTLVASINGTPPAQLRVLE